MRYLVMESELSYAVVLDEQGRFIKVANLGYDVGQKIDTIISFEENCSRIIPLYRKLTSAAAIAACICVLLGGGWSLLGTYGTVRIQINPDVLISVNRFDRVIRLKGMNEDGGGLIEGYPYLGKEMDRVAGELSALAEVKGFLKEDGEITLTVESKSGRWKKYAQERLPDKIKGRLKEDVNICVIEQSTDGERRLENHDPVKALPPVSSVEQETTTSEALNHTTTDEQNAIERGSREESRPEDDSAREPSNIERYKRTKAADREDRSDDSAGLESKEEKDAGEEEEDRLEQDSRDGDETDESEDDIEAGPGDVENISEDRDEENGPGAEIEDSENADEEELEEDDAESGSDESGSVKTEDGEGGPDAGDDLNNRPGGDQSGDDTNDTENDSEQENQEDEEKEEADDSDDDDDSGDDGE